MKKIFCFFVLFLCLAFGYARCLNNIDDFESGNLKESKSKLKADEKALQTKLCDKPCPDFALTDVEGKLWTNQNIKGKVTLIQVWHVYCEACIKEIVSLNELTKKYPETNFLAVTFNTSQQISSVLAKNHSLFRQLPDAVKFISKIGVTFTPTSLLIDKAGHIRYVINGGDKKQIKTLDKKLKMLSKETL